MVPSSDYAQKMFSRHQGDAVLATEAQQLPTCTWQTPARKVNGVNAIAEKSKATVLELQSK